MFFSRSVVPCAVVLWTVPSALLAAVLLPSNLPLRGETLTVTESSQLGLEAGQTATLAGVIEVRGTGVQLTLNIAGALKLSEEPSITVDQGATLEINLIGAIEGPSLHIDNAGGAVVWTNEGSIQIDELAITSTGGVEVLNRGRVSLPAFSVVNSSVNGVFTLLDEGGLSALNNWNLKNDGGFLTLVLSRSAKIPNLSTTLSKGRLEIRNAGYLSVGNWANSASGGSTLSLLNSGMLYFDNVNSQCNGALTEIQNGGALEITNLYLKDQLDETRLITRGPVRLKNVTLVANGALSFLRWENQGTAEVARLVADANYGGLIVVDSGQGDLAAGVLNLDSSGASHGRRSSVELVVGRHFEFDEITMPHSPFHVDSLDLKAGESIRTEDDFEVIRAAADVATGEGSPVFYPQLALGNGYEVILLVSNKSASPWRGTGSLFQGRELDWPGTWTVDGELGEGSRFEIALPADGTRQFVLRGDTALRAGYLEIVAAQGSHTNAIATSFFYNFQASNFLEDSTGVSPAPLSRSFVFPVQKTSLVNTGLAWIAPGAEGSPGVTFTLFDEGGQIAGDQSLAYQGHSARFFAGPDGIFPSVPDGFVGKLKVTAGVGLLLTVLRLESTDRGFQLTSIPADPFTP